MRGRHRCEPFAHPGRAWDTPYIISNERDWSKGGLECFSIDLPLGGLQDIEGKWAEGYSDLIKEAEDARMAASDLREATLLQEGDEPALRRALNLLRKFIAQQQHISRSLSLSLRRTSARYSHAIPFAASDSASSFGGFRV